jgi:hypothetical protein
MVFISIYNSNKKTKIVIKNLIMKKITLTMIKIIIIIKFLIIINKNNLYNNLNKINCQKKIFKAKITHLIILN